MTSRNAGTDLENLLRPLVPQVVGALVRRYGHFDLAEEATQEALLAAALQWPKDGTPDNARGWLITLGSRRMTDLLRSEQARQRRENELAQRVPAEALQAPAADHPQSESESLVRTPCCWLPGSRLATQAERPQKTEGADLMHQNASGRRA